MKKIFFAAAALMILSLSGCYYLGPCIDGVGEVVLEERSVNDFTAIHNEGSFEVEVQRSDSFYVAVEAQENLLSVIETFVSGSTLVVRIRNGSCIRSFERIQVYVHLPALESLKLTGSGKLMADVADGDHPECINNGSGYLSVDTLEGRSVLLENTGSGMVECQEIYSPEPELKLSGSGAIDAGVLFLSEFVDIRHTSSGNLRAEVDRGDEIEAALSGSGRIDLYGEVNQADYTLSSSGRLDALELEADEVAARVSGSGKVYVYALDFLDVEISSSGDVIYRGQPVITMHITGSGDVRPY